VLDIVGKTIGRYEIQAHIGEGGMAQVFRAYDPGIQRAGALKILKEEHCQDEEHMRRFLQEGKAAGALTHPNIVTIYDVGSLEGAPYIMMELLEGETLGEILAKGEKLPLEVILDCAAQIADALDYAHSKGVVHRDMKPDNIILDSKRKTVKIADFGIARIEEGNKETTMVGLMMGTPRYMSPEQASGIVVDGRSDLFAMGVILYEMITGQKAFDAESMPTLILQIVQKNPIPIRQITADAPVGLQKIVNKLLQKKPEKRFQNGLELKEALQRELMILREDQEERRAYLPFQVKWTAIMAAVVALAMAFSSLLIFRAQSEAVTRQAIDSGISLAKFIAVQAAIPVLGEDWISLESLVQDATARDTFNYLVISDHEEVVRGASDSALVGKPWEPFDAEDTLLRQGSVLVSDLGGTFNFNLPVLFNETVVGSVNVGLDTRSLDAALGTTARLLVALGFAIVLVVSLVIYVFNKQIARNLLLATQALTLFRPDHLEARISKQPSDEFGDLFVAFNAMADSLEEQVNASGDAPVVNPGAPSQELDVSGITERMVSEETIVRSDSAE
jgi:HAMP domain-containing protein